MNKLMPILGEIGVKRNKKISLDCLLKYPFLHNHSSFKYTPIKSGHNGLLPTPKRIYRA